MSPALDDVDGLSREAVVRLLRDIRSRPRRKVHEVRGMEISWTSVRMPGKAFNPLLRIEGGGESFVGPLDEAVDHLLSVLRENDAAVVAP